MGSVHCGSPHLPPTPSPSPLLWTLESTSVTFLASFRGGCVCDPVFTKDRSKSFGHGEWLGEQPSCKRASFPLWTGDTTTGDSAAIFVAIRLDIICRGKRDMVGSFVMSQRYSTDAEGSVYWIYTITKYLHHLNCCYLKSKTFIMYTASFLLISRLPGGYIKGMA